MDDSLLAFIRRAVRFTLTILVVAVLLNDGFRLATALSRGFGGLKDATNASLGVASASPNDSEGAQAAAAAAAAAREVDLAAYDQQVVQGSSSIQVTVRLAVNTRVVGSVLVAPVIGLVRGTPSAEWYSSAGAPIALSQTKQVNYFGEP